MDYNSQGGIEHFKSPAFFFFFFFFEFVDTVFLLCAQGKCVSIKSIVSSEVLFSKHEISHKLNKAPLNKNKHLLTYMYVDCNCVCPYFLTQVD